MDSSAEQAYSWIDERFPESRKRSDKGNLFRVADGFPLAVFLFGGCSGKRSPNLGVKDNRLSPCLNSPNCVSSQSDDEKRRIDPP